MLTVVAGAAVAATCPQSVTQLRLLGLASPGERCRVDADCRNHALPAGYEANVVRCVNSLCQQPLAEGVPCSSDVHCASGLCAAANVDALARGERRCAVKHFASDGQWCAADGYCAAASYCDPTLVCARRLQRDEVCFDSREGKPRGCAAGLLCPVSSTAVYNTVNYQITCIQPPGPGALGAGCGDTAPCAGGLYCATRQSPAVCRRLLLENDGCSTTAECGQGLACAPLDAAGTRSSCRRLLSVGDGQANRGTARLCQLGLWRNSDVCAKPERLGALCASDGDCDLNSGGLLVCDCGTKGSGRCVQAAPAACWDEVAAYFTYDPAKDPSSSSAEEAARRWRQHVCCLWREIGSEASARWWRSELGVSDPKLAGISCADSAGSFPQWAVVVIVVGSLLLLGLCAAALWCRARSAEKERAAEERRVQRAAARSAAKAESEAQHRGAAQSMHTLSSFSGTRTQPKSRSRSASPRTLATTPRATTRRAKSSVRGKYVPAADDDLSRTHTGEDSDGGIADAALSPAERQKAETLRRELQLWDDLQAHPLSRAEQVDSGFVEVGRGPVRQGPVNPLLYTFGSTAG